MAKVIALHPSIRENENPRMSAAALAEYLILKPDQQEKVLHDSRFSSPPVVTPYGAAMTAIRAYNANVQRPKLVLENAKASLEEKSRDTSLRPKAQEEARRCIETIELFERGENAFGLRSMRVEECPRAAPLNINGVVLSIQLDLLSRTGISGKERVGGIMFRPQKAPDPEACKTDDTRRARGEHRREMARYMLAMMQMLFEARGETLGTFDRDISFVADLRMGERIAFSTVDHAARVRAIKAACRQVASLWNDIEPKPSDFAR